MNHRLKTAILAGLICLAAALPTVAQDAQYWTQQYGNQARLMGGAVVGGSSDVSATYYNPGRLALIDNPELLLAGTMFEYNVLTLGGAIEDQKFTSSRLGSVPSLFAGQIKGLSKGKNRAAYSFLTRQSSNMHFYERDDLADVLAYPVDLATASFSLDETMNEYWAGFTWARKLSDTIGLGMTAYVSSRSHQSRQLAMSVAAIDETAGTALRRSDFDYYHWAVLAKVGLGVDLESWQLGLTVTTPNLKIMGSGAVGYDEYYITQDLDGDGEQASLVISDFEEDIGTEFHSPASVALGASLRWAKSTFHATAEWFAGVPRYTVLEAGQATSSDGTVQHDMNLYDVRKSILNVGAGMEFFVRDGLRWYTSFRTDFSAADTSGADLITTSTWDIYHISAGSTFSALNSEFTLGLMYAFGGKTVTPGGDVIPGGGDESALDSDTIELRFRRLSGLIGFSIAF